MIEDACNDTTFLIVSMLFDDREASPRYDFFAGSYLEKHKTGSFNLSPLMEDVLKYCHGKSFAVKDADDHRKREQRLRATAEMFSSVLHFYCLKAYDEMRWTTRAFSERP